MRSREGLAPWAGAAVLFAAAAAVIWFSTPWDPLGDLAADPVPPDPSADFTDAERAAADDYAARIRPPALLGIGVGLGGAAVLGFTRLGARVITAAGRLTGRHWPVQVLFGGLAVLLAVRLATLPAAAWAESVRREQGLSTRDWTGWASDVARGFGISAAGTLVAVLVLVVLARWAPKLWWALAAAAAAGLVVVVSFAYPLVVEPVFNDFRPMAEGDLRDSLVEMAGRDGIVVDQVLVADASRRTTTLNAYVSGFGATHRIVVYDNLLASATDDEVRSVVAHELGHVAEHYVRDGTLLGALAAAAAVCVLAVLLRWRTLLRRAGAEGPGDPRVVALVLALVAVLGFVANPVENLISRRVEARADVHALELTRDPGTFVELHRTLARTSYRDLDAPALLYVWFASHPSPPERIALARTWEQER